MRNTVLQCLFMHDVFLLFLYIRVCSLLGFSQWNQFAGFPYNVTRSSWIIQSKSKPKSTSSRKTRRRHFAKSIVEKPWNNIVNTDSRDRFPKETQILKSRCELLPALECPCILPTCSARPPTPFPLFFLQLQEARIWLHSKRKWINEPCDFLWKRVHQNSLKKKLIFEKPKNLQTSEIFAGSVGRRAGGDY